mmetsp:Transcript_90181/g.131986  ORF Transcript_90181/g.131986 Transcript_90181/m.131986 type:complete len:448 (+) Transcript_90181:132-1475(+)|eukprot:CAMPEP_0179430592 /NCGR_PEP_ID=MMETSP0799-20121207/15699_1 /TAXON_ID=46947 /ORGANISM="Geminigera cryophila, Strain CCMP2564" /LENGTH=447 /DNA_ID=CAMNT_0021207111 /DNA_START=174 /DNA_END=1517 /DNA_ORIENTATION=-
MSGGQACPSKRRQSGGAAIARLAGETSDNMKKQNDGIWSRPVSEDDLLKWESLAIGPALSPYAFGFFTFRMQFPEDYPSSAPHIVFLTTNGGKTRFNPNLYSDGKVCLSILGTWRGESGEQWSSVQNCQSVMVSIQSLMDDRPYHNEPGFEKEGGGRRGHSAAAVDEMSNKYNLKITHETLRIGVCDTLEELLVPDKESINCFADIIKWHFLLYFDRYIEIVKKNALTTGSFENMEFEYTRNTMQGTFDFVALETRLHKIKEQLVEEMNEWRSQGETLSAKEALSASGETYACQQVNSAFQKWSRTEQPSISAAPQDNNKFVWNVTIMGDLDGGWYENGIYHLTLTFSPDFPEVLPRPKFVTKMFHPQINEDGFPYLSVSMADSKNVVCILQDIHSLLKRPPSPDPRTWLNKKAAELYFNGGQEEREEYKRTVRRFAQRSMEEEGPW